MECPRCPKQQRTLSGLRIHLRVHLAYLPFRCSVCSPALAFPSQEHLVNHAMAKNHPNPFTVIQDTMATKESELSHLLSLSMKGLKEDGDGDRYRHEVTTTSAESPATEDKEAIRGMRGLEEECSGLPLGKAKASQSRCLLCNVETGRYRKQHVIRDHLKLRAASCGLCPISVSWYPADLRPHFANAHPGEPFQVHDRREEFRQQLKDGILKCFGEGLVMSNEKDMIDPARLGKQREGSKLRYHCRVCDNADVRGRYSHVIRDHLKPNALTCGLCPQEPKGRGTKRRPYITHWYHSDLITHTGKAHPGEEPKYTDRRTELRPKLHHWLQRCFPDMTPTTAASQTDE